MRACKQFYEPKEEPSREEVRKGLLTVYEETKGMEIGLNEGEEFAARIRKIYCNAVGISEDQVKVEVDLFNGIIRIDGVAKSEANLI